MTLKPIWPMKFQYYKPNILLVINPKGEIRKLYAPFRVIERSSNVWVYVDEILSNDRDELFFVIKDQPFLYSFFKITINF
jgi:hypothetical protein